MRIGDGTEPTVNGTNCVRIDDDYIPSSFVDRVILTLRHENVDFLNQLATNIFCPGEQAKEYHAQDSHLNDEIGALDGDEHGPLPASKLNDFALPDFPLSILRLKRGQP
ncbi:hypothetical protein BGW42_000238, partial [Actinomortierella wolfii]